MDWIEIPACTGMPNEVRTVDVRDLECTFLPFL